MTANGERIVCETSKPVCKLMKSGDLQYKHMYILCNINVTFTDSILQLAEEFLYFSGVIAIKVGNGKRWNW